MSGKPTSGEWFANGYRVETAEGDLIASCGNRADANLIAELAERCKVLEKCVADLDAIVKGNVSLLQDAMILAEQRAELLGLLKECEQAMSMAAFSPFYELSEGQQMNADGEYYRRREMAIREAAATARAIIAKFSQETGT